MTQLNHPTATELEVAARCALERAEWVLGHKLDDDPVHAVATLLTGLQLYCYRRAGGKSEVWFDALAEFERLAFENLTFRK